MIRVLSFASACCLLGAAAGCGSSGSSTTSGGGGQPAASTPAAAQPAQSGAVAITYRNVAISPAQITVKVGSTVKWTNADNGVQHNVTVQSGPQTFNSPSLASHASYSFKLTKTGVYNYECTFHPASMVGKITVVP